MPFETILAPALHLQDIGEKTVGEFRLWQEVLSENQGGSIRSKRLFKTRDGRCHASTVRGEAFANTARTTH